MRTVIGMALVAVLASCGSDAPDIPHLDWPASVEIPLAHTPDVYTAMVSIGSQAFSLLVDTGSSTTVVAGASCTACSIVSPLYMPGATATDTGNTASGSYVDQSTWDGELYVDQVGFGSGSPAVPLELASIVDEVLFFKDASYEGIIGLGPPESVVGDTTAFMSTAVQSGAPNLLAFELCDDAGTMWIGAPDASAMAGPMVYTPLVAASDDLPYYNLAVTGLALGGTSIASGAAAFHDAFFDTGTTDFLVPTAVRDALASAIDQSAGTAALFAGQSLATDGCYTAAGVTAAQVDAMLPPLSTSFPDGTGGTVTISAPATRSYFIDDSNGQFCLAVTASGSDDSAVTILGDAFLRGFVGAIDLANQRIGFAPDAGCGGS